MKLHDLKPAPGARTAPRRVGRGTGSGLGKTSGRGHKGQWARSGGGVRPGFEGGQLPLIRRIPKRGFTNIFKKEFNVVNLWQLESFRSRSVVTEEKLLEAGIIKKAGLPLKILAKGEFTKSLTVKAAVFSAAAKEKIEALGGKAEVI